MDLAWLAVPGSLLALGMAALNALTWPRGRPGAGLEGTVSVLIPARNEARGIEACVRSAAALVPPPLEIVVCDDGSTDRTPELLAELQRELPTLRVLRGRTLPTGWVGKPHACHQLGQAARGDWLLFVDADVVLSPDAAQRLGGLARDEQATVLSAVPHQRTGSLGEELLLPLLHLTYTAWFPLLLVRRSRNPAFLAANGQVLALRRDAYQRIGGFEAVRQEVVDDMALCRRAKVAGEGVLFVDGEALASCRMYEDARGVWRGFSKNLYEGLGGHPGALAGVITLYFLSFVAPYLVLFSGLPGTLAPGLVGVGANLALRGLLALRHGHSVRAALLHPLAVLALLALAVNSWRWHARGQIQWAGRSYPQRHLRGAAGGA